MTFMDRLSEAYYAGKPIISNELFDELVKKTGYSVLGTNTETEIRHEYTMYSLKKVYPEDEAPFDGGIVTPKLDGAAVSLRYLNGKLLWAATRGNGVQGLDITEKMSLLVPTDLGINDLNIQIDGEVVTEKFRDNARNYASGALNLKDIEEFKTRSLHFVAYRVSPKLSVSWSDDMDNLSRLDFTTVVDIQNIIDETGDCPYPTDGEVIRINDYATFTSMGYTSKHPRGAYARKENKQGVRSRLRDVIWQVGRSGVVSPVAIIDPVDIDGAIVSRATLHNWKYIEELGLEKDCEVEVIRAGDIIPRIVRKVDD